jgi:hypothetical protein
MKQWSVLQVPAGIDSVGFKENWFYSRIIRVTFIIISRSRLTRWGWIWHKWSFLAPNSLFDPLLIPMSFETELMGGTSPAKSLRRDTIDLFLTPVENLNYSERTLMTSDQLRWVALLAPINLRNGVTGFSDGLRIDTSQRDRRNLICVALFSLDQLRSPMNSEQLWSDTIKGRSERFRGKSESFGKSPR